MPDHLFFHRPIRQCSNLLTKSPWRRIKFVNDIRSCSCMVLVPSRQFLYNHSNQPLDLQLLQSTHTTIKTQAAEARPQAKGINIQTSECHLSWGQVIKMQTTVGHPDCKVITKTWAIEYETSLCHLLCGKLLKTQTTEGQPHRNVTKAQTVEGHMSHGNVIKAQIARCPHHSKAGVIKTQTTEGQPHGKVTKAQTVEGHMLHGNVIKAQIARCRHSKTGVIKTQTKEDQLHGKVTKAQTAEGHMLHGNVIKAQIARCPHSKTGVIKTQTASGHP